MIGVAVGALITGFLLGVLSVAITSADTRANEQATNFHAWQFLQALDEQRAASRLRAWVRVNEATRRAAACETRLRESLGAVDLDIAVDPIYEVTR